MAKFTDEEWEAMIVRLPESPPKTFNKKINDQLIKLSKLQQLYKKEYDKLRELMFDLTGEQHE